MATANGDVSFDSIPDAIEAFGEPESQRAQSGEYIISARVPR